MFTSLELPLNYLYLFIFLDKNVTPKKQDLFYIYDITYYVICDSFSVSTYSVIKIIFHIDNKTYDNNTNVIL